MKLTSVEIHPENSSDVAVLSFRDPRGYNPYNVKSILGLDADEIVNHSLLKRDLIFKLGLNPQFGTNESYSDLRDKLYKMVSSSRTGRVQVQFKNGIDVVAAINGAVSKIEALQFERAQEVQMTVTCEEPMLKALTATVVDVTGFDPNDTTVQDVESTSPHGFIFDLAITADIPSLILTDPDDTWSFEIVPAGGFLTGDVLHFSSEFNSKELYLVRGGTNIYLADVIALGSVWPLIFPGDNVFSFTHPTNVVWNAISYFATYWGV